MKKYMFVAMSALAFSACGGTNVCEDNKGAWENEMKKQARQQFTGANKEMLVMFGVSSVDEYVNSMKFNYSKAEIVKDNGSNVVCKMSGTTKIGEMDGPEEEVMFIRDSKNSGAQRLEIHEKYFKHININTFSDAWAGHTFKHIQSSLPIVKQKRYRTMNQDGALNRMAKFTEEEIISIRKRRDSGENKECVYMDYSDRVLKQTFDNIWDNKTYKNI